MEVANVLEQLTANPDGTFLNVVEFNGRSVGACSITGVSPVWEMHPDTDEFFYIIEGEFQITLLQDGGPRQFAAQAGCSFVVPKGVWHKPGAPNGSKFIYLTPGSTLHSDADDPRQQDA